MLSKFLQMSFNKMKLESLYNDRLWVTGQICTKILLHEGSFLHGIKNINRKIIEKIKSQKEK